MPPLSFGEAVVGLLTFFMVAFALRMLLGWLLQIPAQLQLARENNAMLRSLHAHHGIALPTGVAQSKAPLLARARAAARTRYASVKGQG